MFFLCLRFEGTHQNWFSHIRNNEETPVVGMFYAPWCGHCKSSIPTFMEVAKAYENDTSIAITMVNCSKEEGLCKQMEIVSFPTFVLGFYNKTSELEVIRSKAGIEKVINRILTIKNRKYEQIKEKNPKYPVFQIVVSSKDEESKRIIDVSVASSDYIDLKRIQVSYNSKSGFISRPKVNAIIDEELSIPFDKLLTTYNLTDFFAQNSMPLFGDWTFSSIQRFERRLAMLITKDPNDYKTYKKLAIKFYNMFEWGNDSGVKHFDIASKYFNTTKYDLPAIIVIDSKATYYTSLKNIDIPENLERYEGMMERDVLPKNYFTIDQQHEEFIAGIKYLAKLFMIVFVIVLTLILLIVWISIKCQERKVKKE